MTHMTHDSSRVTMPSRCSLSNLVSVALRHVRQSNLDTQPNLRSCNIPDSTVLIAVYHRYKPIVFLHEVPGHESHQNTENKYLSKAAI